MKNELGEKRMKQIALRSKMYSYITDDSFVEKLKNGTKKCVV